MTQNWVKIRRFFARSAKKNEKMFFFLEKIWKKQTKKKKSLKTPKMGVHQWKLVFFLPPHEISNRSREKKQWTDYIVRAWRISKDSGAPPQIGAQFPIRWAIGRFRTPKTQILRQIWNTWKKKFPGVWQQQEFTL